MFYLINIKIYSLQLLGIKVSLQLALKNYFILKTQKVKQKKKKFFLELVIILNYARWLKLNVIDDGRATTVPLRWLSLRRWVNRNLFGPDHRLTNEVRLPSRCPGRGRCQNKQKNSHAYRSGILYAWCIDRRIVLVQRLYGIVNFKSKLCKYGNRVS